jgi:hypothetical protein
LDVTTKTKSKTQTFEQNNVCVASSTDLTLFNTGKSEGSQIPTVFDFNKAEGAEEPIQTIFD